MKNIPSISGQIDEKKIHKIIQDNFLTELKKFLPNENINLE